MKMLEPGKFYILTPAKAGGGEAERERVLGPFEGHREAWLARGAWAYDSKDAEDRAEILTGEELDSQYMGRWGSVGAAAM